MKLMKMICRGLILVLVAAASTAAASAPMKLTTDIPACKTPPGKVLPDKYYKLKRTRNAFDWVSKADSRDGMVSGKGWERIEGSDMHSWFAFYRVDLNGDGVCDWYVNVSSSLSTGGDRDSINTLYLGGPSGWTRIGATVPEDKPDELGFGKTLAQQHQFTYGEEPSVIHDAASKTNYVIAALYSRHVRRDVQPGYRIYDWDAGKKTLRPLDKWEPGSRAAEVYAFFKAHGARIPSLASLGEADSRSTFDPDVEAAELVESCDPESGLRSAPELHGVVSKHLLARCKR